MPLPIIKQIKGYLVEYFIYYLLPIGQKKLFEFTIRQGRNIVYKYTKKYMGKRLRPHAFRHAFAIYLEKVKGITYTQYWLGHSSIATTQIYAKYNYKRIEDELPEEFKERDKEINEL